MHKQLFVLLLLASLGCAPSAGGPPLITTKGTVTWNGAPLEEGRILFRETAGDKRAYSALIEKGNFTIETTAGNMRVEITASRLIPGKFDTSNITPEPMGEMYIPEKYNSLSELTHDVAKGAPDPAFALTE
ncbi:MAG: hypothetical protein R3C12_01310 [Planctomycetaceae bacterium]|nr:hypothetical protein [Planctomycetaceae bacterium]